MKGGNLSTVMRRLVKGLRGSSRAALLHPVAFPVVRLALLVVVAAAGAWLMASPGPWTGPTGDAADLKLADHVRKGVWLGVAGALLVALGLALTARFWMVPDSARPERTLRPLGKGFWWMLLPVLALAGWLRAPLLTHSLYADEVYSIRLFIHGEHRPDKTGKPRFREADWEDTLWGYRRPNNHWLFSIAARLSNQAWQTFTGASRPELSVTALRMPALVAGLGSIVLAAWFLGRQGFAGAGVVVALLLALHPWHIAHSVEVRGYSFVFLFGTAVLIAAARALETGSWKAWAGLGAAQFCLLYTYPSAVFILVPLVGILAALLWRDHRKGEVFTCQVQRLLVVNLVMTALLLPLVLPSVPQLKQYLLTTATAQGVTAAWKQDVAALFLTGTAWHPWDVENPIGYSLQQMRQAWPVLSGLAFGLLAACGIGGFAGLFRSRRTLFWLLLPFWTAPVIAVAHAEATDAHLFMWHVIFSLPVWLMCSALGMDAAVRWLGSRGMPGWVAWLVPAAGVVVFAIVSQPQRRVVRHHSADPVKEVVQELHRLRGAAPGSRALLGVVPTSVQVYDPAIPAIQSVEALQSLLRQAEAERLPLFLSLSHEAVVKTGQPDLHQLITGSGRFVRVAVFHGLDFKHRDAQVFAFHPAPSS